MNRPPARLRHLPALLLVLLACVGAVPDAGAAPSFGTPVVRHQPDGSAITLYLWGDEDGLVAETAGGFTVVRDADGSWCFARRSADGATLVSSGLRVGAIDPRAAGFADHVRIDAGVDRAQRRDRQQARGMQVDGPGRGRWARRVAAEATAAAAAGLPAPPSRPTLGTYKGLCLLIDFPDSPANLASSEVAAALNQSGYTGMGNAGSLRDYYSRVSGGRVDYTNALPAPGTWATGYYRASHSRSYYDDSRDYYGFGAQELIQEALADLKVREPAIFNQLSYDVSNAAYALNVLYAGDRPEVWATGLWPHQGSLAQTFDAGGGHYISYYEISDLPTPLPLGTICHENGHLLCDFPDLYDYDTREQPAPVGAWCLMGAGGYCGPGTTGLAPAGICGYLRYRAGWADAVDLGPADKGTVRTATGIDGTTSGGNVFRIRKNATEYFLIENRNTAGVDAWLPGPGLAIYHVDEQGSDAHHTTSATRQWECVLVQADGGHDLIDGSAFFGSSQVVFSGSTGRTRFSSQTDPAARWYDTKPTSLVVRDISVPGPTMTFTVDAAPGWVETLTPQTHDTSSHCGSGAGFTALFAILLLSLQAFLRRNGRGR